MSVKAIAKDEPPPPKLAVGYRVTLATLIAVLAAAYIVGVVLGRITKDNRIDAGGLGIIILGVTGILLDCSPDALGRLTLLKLPGIEIALAEVKANQAKQMNQLEDISLILALLLPEWERNHLLNLADGKTRDYMGNHGVRTELRRLRSIGLITMRDAHRVSEMKDGSQFDLAASVTLTELGERWVRKIKEIAQAEVPAQTPG
jgi:hypothetical protein